jgi:hypothetical protein
MKKYLNLATALIASLKPKSKIPIIDTYGQSTLNQDEQQALMEWLFASLMGAGYFGKAHLIWDDGKDREREIFTALMRNEPIFLYRQGNLHLLASSKSNSGGRGASSAFLYMLADGNARVLIYFTCFSCTLFLIA